MFLTALILGEDEGYGFLNRLEELPILGTLTVGLLKAVTAVYFPPFFVLGSPSPLLAGFGLYLVSAGYLAYRRLFLSAVLVLVLPMSFTWWFASKFMGG